ncbi:hypothetical protein SNEBB_001381 [Seison nebaliae]|nr:hypothetical protein SNEBB_001381 [Seison nebaliae]
MVDVRRCSVQPTSNNERLRKPKKPRHSAQPSSINSSTTTLPKRHSIQPKTFLIAHANNQQQNDRISLNTVSLIDSSKSLSILTIPNLNYRYSYPSPPTYLQTQNNENVNNNKNCSDGNTLNPNDTSNRHTCSLKLPTTVSHSVTKRFGGHLDNNQYLPLHHLSHLSQYDNRCNNHRMNVTILDMDPIQPKFIHKDEKDENTLDNCNNTMNSLNDQTTFNDESEMNLQLGNLSTAEIECIRQQHEERNNLQFELHDRLTRQLTDQTISEKIKLQIGNSINQYKNAICGLNLKRILCGANDHAQMSKSFQTLLFELIKKQQSRLVLVFMAAIVVVLLVCVTCVTLAQRYPLQYEFLMYISISLFVALMLIGVVVLAFHCISGAREVLRRRAMEQMQVTQEKSLLKEQLDSVNAAILQSQQIQNNIIQHQNAQIKDQHFENNYPPLHQNMYHHPDQQQLQQQFVKQQPESLPIQTLLPPSPTQSYSPSPSTIINSTTGITLSTTTNSNNNNNNNNNNNLDIGHIRTNFLYDVNKRANFDDLKYPLLQPNDVNEIIMKENDRKNEVIRLEPRTPLTKKSLSQTSNKENHNHSTKNKWLPSNISRLLLSRSLKRNKLNKQQAMYHGDIPSSVETVSIDDHQTTIINSKTKLEVGGNMKCENFKNKNHQSMKQSTNKRTCPNTLSIVHNNQSINYNRFLQQDTIENNAISFDTSQMHEREKPVIEVTAKSFDTANSIPSHLYHLRRVKHLNFTDSTVETESLKEAGFLNSHSNSCSNPSINIEGECVTSLSVNATQTSSLRPSSVYFKRQHLPSINIDEAHDNYSNYLLNENINFPNSYINHLNGTDQLEKPQISPLSDLGQQSNLSIKQKDHNNNKPILPIIKKELYTFTSNEMNNYVKSDIASPEYRLRSTLDPYTNSDPAHPLSFNYYKQLSVPDQEILYHSGEIPQLENDNNNHLKCQNDYVEQNLRRCSSLQRRSTYLTPVIRLQKYTDTIHQSHDSFNYPYLLKEQTLLKVEEKEETNEDWDELDEIPNNNLPTPLQANAVQTSQFNRAKVYPHLGQLQDANSTFNTHRVVHLSVGQTIDEMKESHEKDSPKKKKMNNEENDKINNKSTTSGKKSTFYYRRIGSKLFYTGTNPQSLKKRIEIDTRQRYKNNLEKFTKDYPLENTYIKRSETLCRRRQLKVNKRLKRSLSISEGIEEFELKRSIDNKVDFLHSDSLLELYIKTKRKQDEYTQVFPLTTTSSSSEQEPGNDIEISSTELLVNDKSIELDRIEYPKNKPSQRQFSLDDRNMLKPEQCINPRPTLNSGTILMQNHSFDGNTMLKYDLTMNIQQRSKSAEANQIHNISSNQVLTKILKCAYDELSNKKPINLWKFDETTTTPVINHKCGDHTTADTTTPNSYLSI